MASASIARPFHPPAVCAAATATAAVRARRDLRCEHDMGELAIDYAYGENGRLSSLVASCHTLPYYETVPGSGVRTDTFGYAYDTLGNGFLPSRIAGPVAETVYAWHGGADTFASVTTSSLGYAGTITVAPHPISTHDYGVNSLGQRERIDVRFHQHADFGRRTGYLYDGMGQVGAANASELDLAGTPGPADEPSNRRYAFDEIGNFPPSR